MLVSCRAEAGQVNHFPLQRGRPWKTCSKAISADNQPSMNPLIRLDESKKQLSIIIILSKLSKLELQPKGDDFPLRIDLNYKVNLG